MNLLKTAAFGVVLSAAIGAHAQDVQTESVWASDPVKVDGKPAEWTSGLKGVNKATRLSYTMSNDDKNLYLLIESTDQQNNQKIMAGGITLVVNTDNKKKDKDAFSVTFPVITRNRGQQGQRGQGGGFGGGQAGRQGGGFNRESMTQAQRDSMGMAMRKTQLAGAKEIKVKGFKDIQDSVVSIYNEYGIKATAVFDDQNAYVYELAIPLASLGLSADKPKEFSYQVKVNGLQMNFGGGDRGGFGGGNGGGGFGGGGGGGFGGGGGGFGGGNRGGGFGGGGGGNRGNDMQAMLSPTDFWAKYTLATK